MDKGQIGLRSLIATRQLLLGKAHLASQRPTTSRRHSGPDTAAATGLSRLDQSGLNHTPFFLRLQPFASKIAITDQDGDFTFAELFKRSFHLSLEIKKTLGNTNECCTNQKISLVCPNGVSYVISQWAIWMSGNVVVALSGQHSSNALEYFIKDSESALVISAPSMIDKVEDVAIKVEKPLICLDSNLVAHTNIDFDDTGPFPNLIFNKGRFTTDQAVMLLYLPASAGQPQKLLLNHQQLNGQLEAVTKSWNLDETSSMLHTLSLYGLYGIVSSLMAPLSVGGRVVLLPQFDTFKIWSHLLGIQLNGGPMPRINVYAGVPIHYEHLIKRYQELFASPKIKEYVRQTCTKRINLMTNNNEILSNDLSKAWEKNHRTQNYEKLKCQKMIFSKIYKNNIMAVKKNQHSKERNIISCMYTSIPKSFSSPDFLTANSISAK
jgi:malonyl-CoA/methylmalonyl-CoA synthetase